MRLFADGKVTIRIKDKGCGIENVPQAMEPLFTTGGEERSRTGLFGDGKLYRPAEGGVAQGQGHGGHHGKIHNAPGTAGEAGLSSREDTICRNIGLVHSCARRFMGRGIEYDDLFQAGCMGLVKAADGFDQERGLKFSTYARSVILGEIRRLFRDGGTVKVSRSLKELSMKATRERETFLTREGREPSVGELAICWGYRPRKRRRPGGVPAAAVPDPLLRGGRRRTDRPACVAARRRA